MTIVMYLRRTISTAGVLMATIGVSELPTAFANSTSQEPIYRLPAVVQRVVTLTSTLYNNSLTENSAISAELTTHGSQQAYFLQKTGKFYQSSNSKLTASKLTFYVPVNGSAIEDVKAYGQHDRVLWHTNSIPVRNSTLTLQGHSANWSGTLTDNETQVEVSQVITTLSNEKVKITYQGTGAKLTPKISFNVSSPSGTMSGQWEKVKLKHGYTLTGEGGGTGAALWEGDPCQATVKWDGHTESFAMKSK